MNTIIKILQNTVKRISFYGLLTYIFLYLSIYSIFFHFLPFWNSNNTNYYLEIFLLDNNSFTQQHGTLPLFIVIDIVLIIFGLFISLYYLYSVSNSIIYNNRYSYYKFCFSIIAHSLKLLPVYIFFVIWYIKIVNIFAIPPYVSSIIAFITSYIITTGYSSAISRCNSKKSIAHSINFIFTKYSFYTLPLFATLYMLIIVALRENVWETDKMTILKV